MTGMTRTLTVITFTVLLATVAIYALIVATNPTPASSDYIDSTIEVLDLHCQAEDRF